ncbi:hypothetical protein GCM10023231_18380 [Olivibacter ginsenosidimutans]|uniref:Uncharacterized protein n=1 Tax=Olivibacter ginsenosidimutans TaxID=1176537 RepID=A0ABP9B691_9SPHI
MNPYKEKLKQTIEDYLDLKNHLSLQEKENQILEENLSTYCEKISLQTEFLESNIDKNELIAFSELAEELRQAKSDLKLERIENLAVITSSIEYCLNKLNESCCIVDTKYGFKNVYIDELGRPVIDDNFTSF